MIESEKIVVFIIVLIVIGVVYIFLMVRNLINRNLLYNKLINYYTVEHLKDGDWYKVRYSFESHFRRWLKFIPWSGNGLLVIRNNKIYILCSLREDMSKIFDKKKAHLKWIGRNKLYNGVFSWFCIEEGSKQIYFTSETGFSGVNSDKSTKEIFRGIKSSSVSNSINSEKIIKT